MPWARFDDGCAFHPKILDVGNEAAGAWWRMVVYCCRELTDGKLSRGQALAIAVRQEVVDSLVAVRLLDAVGSGYAVHDFLSYNPSARADGARRDRRSEQARKAAQKRWGNTEQHNGVMLQTMLTTCPDPDPDPDPDPEVPSPEPKSTQIARARESFRPDFERVYALYPRKAGKAAGLASCARQVKTPEQFEELLLAADRFASEVAHEGTEERFIPLFSSWMNGNRSRSWRDSIPSPQERESARVARAFAEKIAADEQAWIDAGGNPFDEDAKARFLAEQRR